MANGASANATVDRSAPFFGQCAPPSLYGRSWCGGAIVGAIAQRKPRHPDHRRTEPVPPTTDPPLLRGVLLAAAVLPALIQAHQRVLRCQFVRLGRVGGLAAAILGDIVTPSPSHENPPILGDTGQIFSSSRSSILCSHRRESPGRRCVLRYQAVALRRLVGVPHLTDETGRTPKGARSDRILPPFPASRV